MPNYRRALVPGGCWFFTVILLDRGRHLLTEYVDALREATQWTRDHYPFHIDAFVVLPEHLRAVWTLPPGDTDFALRWRMIKIRFSKAIPKGEHLNAARQRRGERGSGNGVSGSISSGTRTTTPDVSSIATSTP